uniref:Uncharacterized protein n=1 Tax=Helianthus annuus TaxID=4232 RepID=A0A251SQZ3_HELAN
MELRIGVGCVLLLRGVLRFGIWRMRWLLKLLLAQTKVMFCLGCLWFYLVLFVFECVKCWFL